MRENARRPLESLINTHKRIESPKDFRRQSKEDLRKLGAILGSEAAARGEDLDSTKRRPNLKNEPLRDFDPREIGGSWADKSLEVVKGVSEIPVEAQAPLGEREIDFGDMEKTVKKAAVGQAPLGEKEFDFGDGGDSLELDTGTDGKKKVA